MLEGNGSGGAIDQKMLGAELNRMSSTKDVVVGGNEGEETVDELLQKLAKKGKKVKIINDNDNEDEYGGDGGNGGGTGMDEIMEEDDNENESALQ